jgi:hypothetical protein
MIIRTGFKADGPSPHRLYAQRRGARHFAGDDTACGRLPPSGADRGGDGYRARAGRPGGGCAP